MRKGPDRFGLTAVVLALAALQVAWGRTFPTLYRDASDIALTWAGNDWITLLVALPVIAAAALSARRGGETGRLVWMGGLAFLVYNYAFYMIGTELNAAFPLYVALVLCAAVALGRALLNGAPVARDHVRIVYPLVGFFLLAVAGVLTIVWTVLWHGIVFDDAQGDAEPQASAVVFGGEKWLDGFPGHRLGHPRPIVGQMDDGGPARPGRGRRLLANHDLAPPAHGLAGVDHQIDEHLLELFGIGVDPGQRIGPLDRDRHIVGFESVGQKLNGHVHHGGGADFLELEFGGSGKFEKILYNGVNVADLDRKSTRLNSSHYS